MVKHTCEPKFVATFTFSREDQDTLVDWETHFENEAFVEGAREFLTMANEQNLDRLVDEINRI